MSTKPRAYLNVLFFDKKFTFDSVSSYCKQIGADGNPGQIVLAKQAARLARKDGYAYVYISNESDDLVYFDNLTLTHERGPLTEETHYYPFGLTMAEISSKAANTLDNKYDFTSHEMQNKEFRDGSGLELYDAGWRLYDPQIGRFHCSDPLAMDYSSFSNYNYAFNNPVAYNDPNGASADYVINGNTITVRSTLWFYGGASNKYNATEIAKSIQDQWNAAGATITLKDGDGNDVTYSVSFEVTGVASSEEEITGLKKDGKMTVADNFIRLEEKGIATRFTVGGNDGFMSMEDFNKHKSTAAHEYGHLLNWVDPDQNSNPYSLGGTHDMQGEVVNGLRKPSIMTPSNAQFGHMQDPCGKCQRIAPSPDARYFNANGVVDPDKRKVLQQNVTNVLRNVSSNSQHGSIGRATNLKWNSQGTLNGQRF